ncbi:NAD(P)H-dependent oxidoreductase [Evansella halocellulosilytica]|uniref:NAD(P)H-dependent oxidoreductase n=1 Tax=Evansella halocellulosilytica TaxID=2011013 RepID=UPI000BB83630|nr:NAD(P)H-dependent oxidoreductase [Evansella halocellulosilytica]
MNHLVIFMHSSTDSFNGAILDNYVAALKKNGDHVYVRNLAEQLFYPLLTKKEYEQSLNSDYARDVKEEQTYIAKADVITFIFPMWWGGFPAIGKGYIDRVFSYGFAYRLKNESPIPLLNGKKGRIIFTSGTPEKEMHETGLYDHFVDGVNQSIFTFCGVELEGVLHFGNIIETSPSSRKKMLEKVSEFANMPNK